MDLGKKCKKYGQKFLSMTLAVAMAGTLLAQTNCLTVNASGPALSTDATLSNLTIEDSAGNSLDLVEKFESDTTEYTAYVDHSVTAVKVIPTVNDTGKATVKVADAAVSAGDKSANQSISDGSNAAIVVKVTAEDESTTKTYNINVTRAAENEKVVLVKNGTGSGVYASEAKVDIEANAAATGKKFKQWNKIVGNPTITPDESVLGKASFTMGTAEVKLEPVYADAYTVTVTGGTITKGTATGNYYAGETVSVTASALASSKKFVNWTSADLETITNNDQTVATFTMPSKAVAITANSVDKSADTSIKTITLGGDAAVEEAITADRTEYNAFVANTVRSINVTVASNDANAEVNIDSAGKNKATSTKAITLQNDLTGEKKSVAVEVTAEDGTTKNYTINIYRAGTVAKALTLTKTLTLTKAKIQGTTKTTDNIIPFTPVTIVADGPDEHKCFDKWTGSGSDSSKIVTAIEKQSTATFAMPNSELTLTANYADTYVLTVQNGTITGTDKTEFAKDARVNITANAAPAGKVFKEWTKDAGTFADKDSATTTFTMPASAATVTATYRDKKDKNKLTGLTVNNIEGVKGGAAITLDPSDFDGDINTYSATVDSDTTKVVVTPTVATEDNSTIEVDGTKITSQKTTAEVELSTTNPDTDIPVTVTAENGDVNYYVITIHKTSADATIGTLKLKDSQDNEIALGAGTTQDKDTSYTVSVANNIDKVKLVAQAKSSYASVAATLNSNKINDFNDIDLTTTTIPNVIKVTVTAEDTTTAKTYTIKVTRAKSTDATLKSLKITNSSNVEIAKTKVSAKEYTANVASDVSTIKFVGVSNNSKTTIESKTIKNSKNPEAQTIANLESITLATGENVILVTYIPEEGSAKETYKITVTKAASTNANLSDLAVAGGLGATDAVLSPKFDPDVEDYTVYAKADLAEITLTATAADSKSTVTVAGKEPAAVTLAGAITEIPVVVTAEDKSTKTYNVTVKKVAKTVATLRSLSFTEGTLNEVFNSDTTEYTATVANAVKQIDLSAVATSPAATVSLYVGDQTADKKTDNTKFDLDSGKANIITIVVEGETVSNTKTYKLTVTREALHDATLKELSLSSGLLNEEFDKDTTEYTANVASNVGAVKVTATPTDASATVKYQLGEATADASASKLLAKGENTIKVIVTPEEGDAKTYTIKVTRLQDTSKKIVNVVYGDGDGAYAPGETVTITAAVIPGKRFKSWTVNAGGMDLANGNKAETTFTMLSSDAKVTATYDDVKKVTVTNGVIVLGENKTATEAEFANTEVVKIKPAEIANKEFVEWQITPNIETSSTETQGVDKFTMGSADVQVTAVYKDINYAATVVNGTTPLTEYKAGDEVSIKADAAPAGKVFKEWKVNTKDVEVDFDDIKSAETTFTMPGKAVEVEAVYAAQYALTVNGTAKGSYFTGDVITITAPTVTGKKFKGWTCEEDGVVADKTAAETTITMPEKAIAVTATYVDIYQATVTSGSGSGSYEAGTKVAIKADKAPAGKQFKEWTTTTKGVTFADSKKAETTFTMPAGAVTVEATYEAIPTKPVQPTKYVATVVSGSGSGSYVKGAKVTVTASKAPAGKRFKEWTATSGVVFANKKSTTTTFTMPAGAVRVTATYEAIPAPAPTKGKVYTINKAKYKVTSSTTVSFTGITNKKATKVSVPNTVKINGYTMKVTDVASKALKGLSKVKSVTIGNNVTTIGNDAFYKCKNLKTVKIGTGLKTLGKRVFAYTNKKCVVTINSTKLKTVKGAINQNCKNMTVKVPKKQLKAYKKLLKKKAKKVTVKAK